MIEGSVKVRSAGACLRKLLAFGVCGVLLAPSALATDYSWDNDLRRSKSGYWNDPAMWNGVSYPQTVDDNIFVQTWQAPTLKITNDVEIGSIKGFNYCAATFDLGGNTLTVNFSADYNIVSPTPSAKGYDPGYLPTFKNGTFTMKGDKTFVLGQSGANYAYSGGFTLDNCTSNLKIYRSWCYNPPRITIKNGGVWNYPSGSFYQYQQKSATMRGGYIRVTGAGSQLNMPNASKDLCFEINFLDGGLIVEDGAKVDCAGNIAVSGSHNVGENQWFSTNSYVEVNNATLSVDNKLLLGGYWAWNYIEHYTHASPMLIVKGEKPEVLVGDAFAVFDEMAAKIVYEVPKSGWSTAPIHAASLVIRPRSADYVKLGTTTNIVDAGAWVAMAGTTIPLIELETPNAAALADFAAHAVVTNYNREVYASAPTVSVSDDGTKLLLTAGAIPDEKPFYPVYSVSRQYVSPTNETVTLDFSTFGFANDALEMAKVSVYDNAELTGDPVATYDFDVAQMTEPEGSYVTAVVSGLVERTVYYVKVTVRNEMGYETVNGSVDFSTGAATGMAYYWCGGSNVFEKASNWCGENHVAVTSYPTVGDIIQIGSGNAVIVLEHDERICRISISGGDYAPVIDFNGHTLFTDAHNNDNVLLARYNYATAENLDLILPALTLKNGTVDFPRGGYSLTFGFNNGDRSGTGSLVFDNCTYKKGKLFRYVRNGFRVFIQNGSYVVVDGHPDGLSDFAWNNGATDSAYGFICVRGAGSYFATSYDNGGSSRFAVNGNHNGLYVLDGASALMTMSLCIGGNVRSTNNFVQVDNATLTPKYNLAFGFSNSWGTWVEVGTVYNPQLRIQGTNARVPVGKDLRILDGIAAEIRYTVPTNGFAATPLTAKTLTICEPTLGQSAGLARFYVDAKDWKLAHPEETQTLLTLETANKTDLQRLVSQSKVNGSRCTLSVTDDGKSVVLTAPPRGGLEIIFR